MNRSWRTEFLAAIPKVARRDQSRISLRRPLSRRQSLKAISPPPNLNRSFHDLDRALSQENAGAHRRPLRHRQEPPGPGEPLRLSPASDRSRCIASIQRASAVTNLCESLRTVSNRRKLYSMVAERHWQHWQGSNRCLGRVSVVLAGWFGVEFARSAILLSGPLNLHGGVRAHGNRIGISEAV